MPGQSLEERVAGLEQQMGRLVGQRERGEVPLRSDAVDHAADTVCEPGLDDWKSTVGMFRGDPFKEMIDETTQRREEERRQARGEVGTGIRMIILDSDHISLLQHAESDTAQQLSQHGSELPRRI